MKKILAIVVLSLCMVIVSAQVASTTILIPNTYGGIVSPTATASIYKITNTTVGYVLFKTPMSNGSKQDFTIKLDSVSGNHTNVAVAIYGQKSELKGDWTQIGSTINWVGALGNHLSADTTFIVSNATYNYYRNYKIQFTGTGTGITKLTYNYLKLWLE